MSLAVPRPRRLAATVLSAATVLALVETTTSAAAPTDPTPTAAARAAGVEPGNAAMGWRQDAVSLTGAGPAARPSGRATTQAVRKAAFVPSGVLGIDVSSHQGRVNWGRQVAAGKRFAYVKATEGLSYRNPYFSSQYTGSYYAGMIRGAYHFASPARSSGKRQAAFFVRNGGGWSPDGKTLPGVLDIEYNPYGRSVCYGLTKRQMVGWINSFVTEYKRLTGRDAVIYTTTDWWTRCTGNTARFSRNPLWLARYGATSPGKLPAGWSRTTFWQYTSVPIDQNRFHASHRRLVDLAMAR